MTARIMITLCILLYAAGVPYLEVNETHVFNMEWPSHARLHNVWQLITNSLIGVTCLWMVWARNEIRLPVLVSTLVMGGFMLAYSLSEVYQGSMKHTDGSEVMALGLVNIGVAGYGLGLVLLAAAFYLDARSRYRDQAVASV
tara:strand:+ start:731 stop:1156 length:426 start_codon:yes stop_codon:yes gene_type:complete